MTVHVTSENETYSLGLMSGKIMKEEEQLKEEEEWKREEEFKE